MWCYKSNLLVFVILNFSLFYSVSIYSVPVHECHCYYLLSHTVLSFANLNVENKVSQKCSRIDQLMQYRIDQLLWDKHHFIFLILSWLWYKGMKDQSKWEVQRQNGDDFVEPCGAEVLKVKVIPPMPYVRLTTGTIYVEIYVENRYLLYGRFYLHVRI